MKDHSPRFERDAAVFKALGHPVRLALVVRLGRAEAGVGDLHQHVGGNLSNVSRHLAVLRGAGLVDCERRGAQVVYRLVATCVLDFCACLDRTLGDGLVDLEAAP